MIRRYLISALVSLVFVGCSDASGPRDVPDPVDVMVGTWQLQTVNGQSLPFTLEGSGSDKVELAAESITLTSARRLTMLTTFRITDGGIISGETIPDAGTYSVSGSTALMKFDSDPAGGTITATVSGDIMTLDDIGLRFVYRRQ